MVTEASLVVPQRLNVALPYDLAMLVLGLHPQRIENQGSNRYFYVNIRSNIFTVVKSGNNSHVPQLRSR